MRKRFPANGERRQTGAGARRTKAARRRQARDGRMGGTENTEFDLGEQGKYWPEQ